MQYEAYEQKIKKVASFLALILRHIVLVITVLLLIVGSITAIIIFKGSIISVEDVQSFAYGDTVSCKANALLSPVSFEFLGSDGQWSDNPPVFPGDYSMRIISKGSFGTQKCKEGLTLRITPAPLTVSVAEEVVQYGSTPTPQGKTVGGDVIECTDFSYSASELDISAFEGRFENVFDTGKITPDANSIKVFNAEGKDVSDFYLIDTLAKDVGIVPCNITVTVEDKEKIYDGVSLEWDAYEITEGELVEGDRMIATFNASITEVGSVENAPELVFYNEAGDEINFAYNVNLIKGVLSVKTQPLYIKSGSDSFVYSGKIHYCRDYSIEDGKVLDGHQLRLIKSTGVRKVSESGAKNDMLFAITDAQGRNVEHCYSIILEAGTLEVSKKSVSVIGFINNETFEYDGKTRYYGKQYVFSPATGTLEMGRTLNQDGWCDAGVYYTKDAPIKITSEGGEDITENFNIGILHSATITITPAKVTISTTDYRKEYDGRASYPDWNTSVTVTGNSSFVCQQIILEPYDSENHIDVGIYENKPIIAIYGNTKNYDITYGELGRFEVYKKQVTLTVENARKIYDDTPLRATSCSVNALVAGHKMINIEYTGSITEVKESRTVPASVIKEKLKITDKFGNGDFTHNYEIIIKDGTLTVMPRPLTVITASGTREYDAEPFTLHEIEATVGLLDGHNIECKFMPDSSISEIPKGEEVGMVGNALYPGQTRITRADGTPVQDNYDISYEFGVLTLTKREITVATGSNKWEYDGNEHYDRGYSISKGTLVSAHGHRIEDSKIISEVVIDAGTYDNWFYEIIIKNSRNVDVSHNYNVSIDCGALEITARRITVTTGSASKVYDGKPLYSHEATADRLIAGHEIYLHDPTLITNVKESGAKNEPVSDPDIHDSYGNSVSHNYEIVGYKYGTLEITARPVTVTTQSIKRIYSGNAIYVDRGSVDFDGIEVYAQLYGYTQHRDKGEVPNKCDISKTRILTVDGVDITDNFNIIDHKWGTLNAIYGEIITVAVSPKARIYTGSSISIPISDFDLEILTPGNFTINYGGLTVSRTDCGIYTLADLNADADKYNITVSAHDPENRGKEYMVIFVSAEGIENDDYAVLTINRRAITLTAASATCVYRDNAILICNDADITKGSLVSGHKLEFACSGRIDCSEFVSEGMTSVNSIVEWRIFDKYGEDVSKNYDVTTVDGLLTLVMDAN